MARQVLSRTQRRMEKKQAMVLLLLVLAVSLVSFTLGVMVGRGSTPEAAPPPPRLPVAPEPTAAPVEAPAAGPEALTFYESLPKGEQPPLGSGINLPPAQEVSAVPEAKVQPPAPSTPPTPSSQPAASTAPTVPAVPEAGAGTGPYVVQVASFREADDARTLQERLAGQGYAAFSESVELAEKGTWHRVFAGTFADAPAAEEVVKRLLAEEKLSALVKRR